MARLNKEQHQDIINRYQAGELCSDLAREFSVDRSSVYALLKRRGVQMQQRSYIFRKASGHFLDETVFESINDSSAYWIGFLLADGAVVNTTVALVLQDQDYYHLEKFRQFVGGSQSLVRVESSNSWRYAFQSQKIVDDLGKWGVTPRKSHTATVHPNLKDNYHFWRGLIDGDGSLGLYKHRSKAIARLDLCGSCNVIRSFCDFALSHFNLRLNPKTHKSIHRVQAGGRTASTLVNAIYGDAALSLDRKALSAYNILQWSKS